MVHLLFAFLLAFQAVSAYELNEVEKSEYEYMDNFARIAGTDKSSIYHNYTEVYAQYFKDIKNTNLKFLEIGIFKGDSVKMWENYFPNADLHFMDITNARITHYSDRSKYYYLDQSNPAQLYKFGKEVGGDFDVIIDDGGHTMEQQIISFHNLFPLLKSGGLYIIEDLHTSYWKEYGGNGTFEKPLAGKGTAVEFLKNLVEDLNQPGAKTTCADYHKAHLTGKPTYQNSFYYIHFYPSVCIIKKR